MKQKLLLLLLCVTMLLSELPAWAAEGTVLDLALGDVEIQGQQAAVGGKAVEGESFVVVNSGRAGTGGTLRIYEAEKPVRIAADASAKGGRGFTSRAPVTVDDGVFLDAPSIKAPETAGGISVTRYPLRFAGLKPNQPYSVRLSQTELLSALYDPDTAARTVTRKTDRTGALNFWLKEGESVSLAVASQETLWQGTGISGRNVPAQKLIKTVFSSGSGTEGDPWLIAKQEQLAGIARAPWAHYRLAADLEISEPLAFVFSGSLDGDGHTLTLFIGDSGDTLGATGLVRQNEGLLKNLRLAGDVTATRSNGRAGAAAGINRGVIAQVSSSASVTASETQGRAGGLAGENSGEIVKSSVSGRVYASGTRAKTGGIAGENSGKIHLSYTSGTVSASGSGGLSGGIAGESSGEIQNCYTLGSSSADKSAGGLVGRLTGGGVEFCYAAGTVKGGHTAGGISGWMTDGIIRHCLSLNSAVTGGTAGRVTAAKLNGLFREGFGLAANYGFEKTALNGEYAFLYAAPEQMHGESLSIEQISGGTALARIGFAPGNGWTVSAGQRPILTGLAGQDAAMPAHLTADYTRTAVAAAVYEPGTSEDDYWKEVKREIKYSDGQTIKIRADDLRNMPASILRELQGKNVTLEITRNRAKLYLYGGAVGEIPANKVFYTWDDLYLIYGNADNSPPSAPASSSEPDAQISTLLPDEQDGEDGSSAPSGSEQSSSGEPSEPGSSIPDPSGREEGPSQPEREPAPQPEPESEPEVQASTKPKKQHRSIVPLVIAGGVILCAVGVGALVISMYYRHSRADDYEDYEDYDDEQ